MKTITIAAPHLLHILEGAVSKGHDVAPILQRANIDPQQLQQPRARVTGHQFWTVAALIIRLTGDESYGLHAIPIRPGTFEVFASYCLNQQTLGESLIAMVKFFSLSDNSLIHEFSITDQGGEYSLRRDPGYPLVNNLAIESMLFITHRLLCWLANRQFALQRVELDYAAPDIMDDYRYMFLGSPVLFAKAQNKIIFPADSLSLLVVQDKAALRSLLKHVPMALLSQNLTANSLQSRIRSWLVKQLSEHQQLPELEQTAEYLQLAPTVVRRLLKKEATSYNQLKSEVRRDMAINYLNIGKYPVKDIAYRLGFSEPSTFIRAFKSWTGSTPALFDRQ
jgi:AraC-like DNA-binding protein